MGIDKREGRGLQFQVLNAFPQDPVLEDVGMVACVIVVLIAEHETTGVGW